MNNEEKKIVGYDPQTGQPIYEENTQPVTTEPKKKSKAGLIIGIIIGVIVFLGLCIFGIIALLGVAFNSNNPKGPSSTINEEKTYYGETFKIKYSYPWKEATTTLTTGEKRKLLAYNDEVQIVPVGSSALDEADNIDFSTYTGKATLYNEFRKYWGESNTIGTGTGTFLILKDDIYYASMEYTKGNAKGKLYLVVSEDNNIILSFMTAIKIDQETADQRVLELLKNITIDTKYDDDLANSLDQMSNWNMYKSVRTNTTLGKKRVLDGGWRVLSSDGEAYWIFKGNEYWWYKSYKDLNDNYWYGTVQVYRGKEGYKKVGLDPNKIDEAMAKDKKMKETDFYTTIFTPKKIMSNGEDKSSTNIAGEDWHMVWILVDHGSEGIEAQQLNVKTADTSFFVKVKD